MLKFFKKSIDILQKDVILKISYGIWGIQSMSKLDSGALTLLSQSVKKGNNDAFFKLSKEFDGMIRELVNEPIIDSSEKDDWGRLFNLCLRMY